MKTLTKIFYIFSFTFLLASCPSSIDSLKRAIRGGFNVLIAIFFIIAMSSCGTGSAMKLYDGPLKPLDDVCFIYGADGKMIGVPGRFYSAFIVFFDGKEVLIGRDDAVETLPGQHVIGISYLNIFDKIILLNLDCKPKHIYKIDFDDRLNPFVKELPWSMNIKIPREENVNK